MKKYLINKHSNSLLLFFTGWGCDEYEFEHLNTNSDVLLLYDYQNLNLDFDFNKYDKINVLAFSAGVFIASVFNYTFEAKRKIALSGNPYLFDEHLGLSKEMQNMLCNINIENADYFAKNYLVKTEEEYSRFHHSKRNISSSQKEYESLKKLYKLNKEKIKDIFTEAIIGEDDKFFNVEIQKEFYGHRLKIIKNARHSLFFRINSYEEILKLADNN